MFLFNSNHGNDPISFPDHPFFHFPSPFHDDAVFLQQPQHDIFLNHQPLNDTPPVFGNMADSGGPQQRGSSAKRDRHSKINTLRGPRDRRMRLSLPVAREFFGLQDMLGVDKASKTVEWLLFQARHAINKLSRGAAAGVDERSPSSDGEVVSGIDEIIVNNSSKLREKPTTKEKRSRVARKTAAHPLAREVREKARARARARTREKRLRITQKSQISAGEESVGTQMEDQRSQKDHQQMFDDQDDSLMIIGMWSPSNSMYPSLHSNNVTPQEHPFGDLQFFGKPWEAYSNHSIC